MLLKVTNFSGMIPQVPAVQLPENAAQNAVNARLTGGALSAYKSLQPIAALTKAGAKKTIYRFGQNEVDLAKFWFVWDKDVDVARGQIAADETERTFFTGPGAISGKTNYNLAVQQAGNAYPSQQFSIGIPTPEAQLITVAGAVPQSTAANTAADSAATAASTAAGKNTDYQTAIAARDATLAVSITSVNAITDLNVASDSATNQKYSAYAGVTLYTTTDNVNMVARTIAYGRWLSAAWNGTVFCAIDGSPSGGVATSTTGAVWTPVSLSGIGVPTSITWNGTYFVVSKWYGTLAYTGWMKKSTDGATWTDVATPPTKACNITASNPTSHLTVAIGAMQTSVFTSATGDVWVERASKLPEAYWTDLVFDGTNFIAFAQRTSSTDPTPRQYTSSDGITWTAVAAYSYEEDAHVRMTAQDGVLYAIQKGAATVPATATTSEIPYRTTKVYKSSNSGLSWTVTTQNSDLIAALLAAKGISTSVLFKLENDVYAAVPQEAVKIAAVTVAETAYNAAKTTADNLAKVATAVKETDAATPLEDRYYAYTFVTSWGEESLPSPPSIPASVRAGQEVKITGFTIPTTATANLNAIRLYRTQSGSNATDWQFVTELPLANYAQDYVDTTRGEDLGEIMPSLNWTPPPAGLRGITNLPNGIMAGMSVDDSENPLNDIYFSEAYRPFAWPASYSLTLDYPVVGLGVIGSSLVAVTKGNPYIISGIDPSAMSSTKIDAQQACVSKRSVVSMGGAVLYASPDGLVAITGAGADIISKQHFTRREWQALKPEAITACQYDMRYFAFFEAGGGFIFDPAAGTFVLHDINVSAAHSDLRNDALFMAVDGAIKQWDSGTSYLPYVWKSKKFEAPKQINFAWGQAFCTGDLTLNVYADGRLVVTHSVTSGVPFRMPAGFLARYWELELVGTAEVTAVYLAQSMAELQSV